MIQLSSEKKFLILISIIVIASILLFIVVVKNKKAVNINKTVNIVTSTKPVVRDMTREEKINVGISPNQGAEVVNDQNGLFIYKIKK